MSGFATDKTKWIMKMTNCPKFVTVNTSGTPAGHETRESALEAHLFNIGGAWNLFGDKRDAIEAELAGPGRASHFTRHQDGTPPLAAGVFENTSGLEISGFKNAHLLPFPKSRSYLAEAVSAWSARPGPRIGDFVNHADGTQTRFTWNAGGGMQAGGGNGMGFHLSRGGLVSYSGSLSSAIPTARIAETGETKDGAFWFFLDGWAGAHRGIAVQVPCRVYRELSDL